MSLTDIFSNRSVSIALAPDLLSAVVRSGKRIVAHSELRLPSDQGHWQGALTAFSTYLRGAGVNLRGAPVTVSLSTRWCRLAMLPWSEALRYQDSARRVAGALFSGIDGADWGVVCDEAAPGQARLACAIERELLQGLHNVALDTGHPCALIESALSSAWRSMASARIHAFALIEPGRLVLASAAQGRIAAVQVHPLAHPHAAAWQGALPAHWQRWTMRAPELGEIAQVALVNLDPSPRYSVPAWG